MNKEILQIIMAGIGTLGFSIYFRVSEKNVAASTIGGQMANFDRKVGTYH